MDQDWKPILFKKKTNTKDKKKNPKPNSQFQKIDKTEVGKIKKVSRKTASAISKRRTELKLSQKDLASKLSIKPEIINSYEKASIPPNQSLIMKMERVLGVHLTGDKTGEFKK